ncbi:MAG: hypothetical protein ACR2JJ_06080 [Sphingomicrobium sp.]
MRRLAFGLYLLVGVLAVGSNAQAPEPGAVAVSAELKSKLDSAMSKLLEPGPRLDGWENQGLDVLATLESKEGGIDGNALLFIAENGKSSVSIYHTSIERLSLSDNWLVIDESSEPPLAGPTNVSVAVFSPGFYSVVERNFFRKGRVVCGSKVMRYKIYKGPDSETSRIPEPFVIEAIKAIHGAGDKFELCNIYTEKNGGLHDRLVTSDGLTFPNMEAGSVNIENVLHIVPIRPIDEMLRMPSTSD